MYTLKSHIKVYVLSSTYTVIHEVSAVLYAFHAEAIFADSAY